MLAPRMAELTLIGGPTALIEYGGLRWLTDPTLSPPGDQVDQLTKTTGPALEADALGAIDVVLLSHDEHSDNLDPAGRAFLPRAGGVLTTAGGAERLAADAQTAAAHLTGMEPWAEAEVGSVHVTAVPGAARTARLRARGRRGDRLRAQRRIDARLRLGRQRLGPGRAGDRRALWADRRRDPVRRRRADPRDPRRRLPHAVKRPGRAGRGEPRLRRSSSRCTSRAGRTSLKGPTSCARASPATG